MNLRTNEEARTWLAGWAPPPTRFGPATKLGPRPKTKKRVAKRKK